jgi:hypothetical protein
MRLAKPTEFSSMYGIGMSIAGVDALTAVNEKARACRAVSPRREGSNLDLGIMMLWWLGVSELQLKLRRNQIGSSVLRYAGTWTLSICGGARFGELQGSTPMRVLKPDTENLVMRSS